MRHYPEIPRIMELLQLDSDKANKIYQIVESIGAENALLAANKTKQNSATAWPEERVFGYFCSLTWRIKNGQTVALIPQGLMGYSQRKNSERREADLDRGPRDLRPDTETEFWDPRVEPNYDTFRRNQDYEDNQ
jgi:hypothetical protein